MNTLDLLQLEKQIRGLSTEEQFWLLEQVIRHIRQKTGPTNLEADLAAMAADPDIQRELRQINNGE